MQSKFTRSISNHHSTMQSPIPQGSVLRDRYIVKHVIGQGGMGRTYVAQDMERFNETCVLKEFIPQNQSPAVMVKARELFQREASILYQIKHPQVPEFRATFEVDSRLFLVQDYVEGKTYRALLQERRKQGSYFTELEIITLLKQVLPILGYLHSRNIIHRDVSPENLMLRSQDQLPVLIDFGVVKETATKLQSEVGLPQSTMAGKLGYAPPEQMQTGRAYASSDLYALAVTSIVLLTGHEPQDLFDDSSLSWRWQQFVNVSPVFAQVINRMLSYKPADRYSSADEVLQALQTAQASLSQVKTFAVGRQPAQDVVANTPQKTIYAATERPSRPRQTAQPLPVTAPVQSSRSDNGINFFWGLLLVVISGVASWAIASTIFERGRPVAPPTPEPSRTTEATTPVSTPTATPTLTNITKNLEFPDNSTRTSVTGRITAGQTITYRFSGRRSQNAIVSLDGTGLQMNLIFQDQKPIDNRSSNVEIGYWEGKLPGTGAYFIKIKTVPGTQDSNYTLSVQLGDNTPTPKPTPTSSSSPLPTTTFTPSTSPTGSPSVPANNDNQSGPNNKSVEDRVRSGEVKTYRLSVQAGQTMVVMLRQGADKVQIDVYDPKGNPVYGRVDNNAMQIDSTKAGTYEVIVKARTGADADFALDMSAK